MRLNHLTPANPHPTTFTNSTPDLWLDWVRQQVASLKFGTVQITVHEARVVQVERVEKLRFTAGPDGGVKL